MKKAIAIAVVALVALVLLKRRATAAPAARTGSSPFSGRILYRPGSPGLPPPRLVTDEDRRDGAGGTELVSRPQHNVGVTDLGRGAYTAGCQAVAAGYAQVPPGLSAPACALNTQIQEKVLRTQVKVAKTVGKTVYKGVKKLKFW